MKNALSPYFLLNPFVKICINFIQTSVVFTANEILLDRVPCFYFYYTLTTTTKVMFSIITNHKTVDDTEKNCKKFQALHFESNKHNFQNHVYQCNAPCLNLRRCNVFFKQHTLANVGNTRHLLLLI